ncbi:MAG: tRNA (adenosine(37)-N6)-threonylcarbamoyltransferase complex dimerization subunit type 1 TsaB [Anaerolineae bacterium]
MLLAIDTSTRSLSLALYDGTQVIAEATWVTEGRHTVELMAAIQALCKQSEIALSSLTLLAVAQGPGSFNGLRVGFSAAKGLALALGLPLIAVPTLDITSAAQPAFDGALIAVAQAGRGRVVAGAYDWIGDGWQAQHGENDLRIVGWATLLDGITSSTLISGEIDQDGLSAIRQAIADGKPLQAAPPAFWLRRAGFLAMLAWERWSRGEISDTTGGAPFYLHQPGVPHP